MYVQTLGNKVQRTFQRYQVRRWTPHSFLNLNVLNKTKQTTYLT